MDDEDNYKRRRKNKAKAKVDEKALKKATQKLRGEMEEKFKTLKAETANCGEVLAVQTAYQGTGNNQQGRATDSGQGGGYTCCKILHCPVAAGTHRTLKDVSPV